MTAERASEAWEPVQERAHALIDAQLRIDSLSLGGVSNVYDIVLTQGCGAVKQMNIIKYIKLSGQSPS